MSKWKKLQSKKWPENWYVELEVFTLWAGEKSWAVKREGFDLKKGKGKDLRDNKTKACVALLGVLSKISIQTHNLLRD